MLVLPSKLPIWRPHWRPSWKPLLMSHLQLKTGHLAYTATSHLAKCSESCPGLSDVDWYLYLCEPSFPSSWCPTEDFRTTAINLGTLVTGFNYFSQSDYSCVDETWEEYCNGSLVTSCTRTLDFTDVDLIVEVTGIAGGYEFDVSLVVDMDTTNCSGGASNLVNLELLTSVAASYSDGEPATCLNGVYGAGTYGHRNVSFTVLLCDGINPGQSGVFFDPSFGSFHTLPTDFYVAPLSSLPACS